MKSCLRFIFRIFFSDIFFDIFAVADQQVRVSHHSLFGMFPVPPDSGVPFCPLPFVAVRIDEELSAQRMDLLPVVRDKRSDPAGEDVKYRSPIFRMFFAVGDAGVQRRAVIVHGLRAADVRHLHAEASRPAVHVFPCVV